MKKITTALLSVAVCSTLASAGQIKQVFEEPKDTSAFNGVEFNWGADLTFNYQALDQDFDLASQTGEEDLQPGLTLPTANLAIDAKVMKGFNVKLETMLSSHHHNETFVKGGYAAIDSLDWLVPGLAAEFMKYATIKVGVHDINYGDAHFRRTDNAKVFNNPFIHNMAVEAYMVAGFLEGTYRIPAMDSLVVLGFSNGQVNPNDVVETEGSSSEPAVYGKFAYDKQLSDALRFRVSESVYYTSGNGNNSLYFGDKAGTVSTDIFNFNSDGYDWGSNWNAMSDYEELTASMTNVFVKYEDTELFGLVEFAESQNKEMLHYSVELVQRFWNDKLYAAARYENATVETDGDATDDELTQYQIALGWFFSKNAMAKLEYIKQERENMDTGYVTNYTNGEAEFDGFMLSTALSF